MTISVHEAKARLSQLLDLVENGEEVVIARHGRPVAQLVPAHALRKPRFGAMRGEIAWEEGWERPLTAEETEAFWDGKW